MSDPIRIGLVDDQALVRMGLKMVLDAEADITVVAEASNGDEAIALAASDTVDILLMDVRMPGTDGISATEAIAATGPTPRIIVLTTFDLDEYAYAAIRAGAAGFLLKDAHPTELLAAIRAVYAGDAALAPSVTKRMLEQFAEAPAAASNPASLDALSVLTPREHEIFVAIGEGLSNDELAEKFFLSASTVKTHISRLLAKLDARDRVQLVILAYEAGVVGR